MTTRRKGWNYKFTIRILGDALLIIIPKQSSVKMEMNVKYCSIKIKMLLKLLKVLRIYSSLSSFYYYQISAIGA